MECLSSFLAGVWCPAAPAVILSQLLSALDSVKGPPVGKGEGSRLVGRTRLVVFPRFLTLYRPKNTTSRDPYPPSSWDPTLPARNPPPLLHLFGKGQGARGPGSRGGLGSWLSRTLGGLGVGIPRAGSPQRAGTLPLLTPGLIYTPARNCCEINSENILSM